MSDAFTLSHSYALSALLSLARSLHKAASGQLDVFT